MRFRAGVFALLSVVGSGCVHPAVPPPVRAVSLPHVDPQLLMTANQAALIGTVTDSTTGGSPLTRLAADLIYLDDSSRTITSIDSAGGFYLPALRPGRYHLRIRAIGYTPFFSALLLVPGTVDTVYARIARNYNRLLSNRAQNAAVPAFAGLYMHCPDPLFMRWGQTHCVIPRFASAWVDSTGTLVARLTDLSDSAATRAVLEFAHQLSRETMHRLRFEKSEFSYSDFESFKRKLMPFLGPGVTRFGMDARNNQIWIFYNNEEARQRVFSAIKALNIPERAVRLEKGEFTPTNSTSSL